MKLLLSRLLLPLVLLAAALCARPARAEVTYVMALDYSGIYSVDVSTGGPATLILALPGGKQGYTLATRPSDGMLFYLDSSATNPNLWRWDPNNPTTAPVLLGTPGATANIVRLGFDTAGNLLAMDTSTSVWTLDTNTGGILTSIPLSGNLPNNSGDLCLNPVTGVLYMVATNDLYTVGPTGVSTLLGAVTGTANSGTVNGWITGCSFTANGTMLVSLLQGGALYKVNVSTLAATALPTSSGAFQIGDLSTAPGRVADLSLTKVAADPRPGSAASFTVTVSNAGPGAATDVRVLDPTPAGLTFSSATASQGTFAAGAATVGTNTYPAGTWRVGRLAAGQSATLTLNYAVTGTTTITNTAQVSYSDQSDPNSTPGNSVAGENDQASATVTPSPDLRPTKTANSSFAVGSPGSYAITVANVGTVSSSGTYTVTDNLPPGLTFLSATGTSWTCAANTPTGANVPGGAVMSCTSSSPIAGGATSSPITLTVSVAAAASPTVTNAVTVTGGGEPTNNNGNNTGSTTTPVCNANCPDLVVNKSGTPNPMTVGATGTYTLSVTNRGGLVTTGTYTLTDALPAGLTIATAPTGTGWACTGAAGTTTVSCSNATPLAPGVTSTTVSFTVNVGSASYPQVANTATVSGGGEPTATQGNNSTTLTTPVQDFDLTITKTTPGSFTVGSTTNASYTLTVSNVGPRGAPAGVTTTVTDTLPAGVTVRTAPTGTNWICTGAAGATSFSCTSTAAIAAGASANAITVGVTIGGAAAPSATNTATVSNPQEQSTLTGNNTASVTTPVPATDLVVTKSHNGSFNVGGTSNTWTLTVTNIGAVASTGTITLSDALPAGVTLASAPTGTGWTCGGSSGSASFSCTTTGAIAANASASPVIVTVNTPTAGSVTNTATVSGGGEPSGNTGNNSGSDTAQVFNPPTFTKSFASASAQAGAAVQMTFTITNVAFGPASLQGISFVDNMPAGMTVASPPGLATTCGGTILAGSQTGDTQVALSGGSIAGQGVSCTINVNIVATVIGTNTNTTSQLASANGGTAAPATASISITAPTNPVLTKVASPNPIGLGEVSTLTFRITNKTTATNEIGFTDTLPSGVVASGTPTFGGTCASTGGTALSRTYIAPAGTTPAKITLAGIDMLGSANCTITLQVTSFTAGSYANTSANISTPASPTLDVSKVSDTLVVQQATLTKTFSPASIFIGQTASVTFVVTSTPEAPEFNGISFTESLPSGLTLAAVPTASQCNGTVGGTVGGSTITVTNTSLAAAQASCSVTALVTSTTAATYTNTNTNITSASANLVKNVNASLVVQQSLPSLAKTVTLLNDPVNGTSSPKAIPGAEMLYAVTLSNLGPVPLDLDSAVVTDPIPANTMLFVGSLGAPAGPIGFSASTTPAAGLTYAFIALGDTTDDLSFSSTPASPFAYTYTPVPDANGYDANVTAIRINPKGKLAGAAAAPFPSVTFTFKVKVK